MATRGSQKPLRQGYRLAIGDTVKGYARGGRVGMPTPNRPLNNASTIRPGLPVNPLTMARRSDGIPNKCGGSVGKKK